MANKSFFNFSGGMNSHTAPLIIKDDESELILNYNLDKLGALTKRNGYITYLTQPVADNIINGLYGVSNAGWTTARTYAQVMSVNNAADNARVLYYNAAGTWTATNLTTDQVYVPGGTYQEIYPTRFFTFLGYTFRINGGNTARSSNSANLSTWSTTNCPGTIAPHVGAVFQDRVYLGQNLATEQSRLYFSSLPAAGAITWDLVNDYFDVNPDDGDYITALENNGNRLLIFKSDALYRWTFGQVEADRLIGVGASNQEVVKTNFDVGITFFANPYGVYGYSGDRPKLLSRKIQEYIDAVTDWVTAVAEVDNEHYYLSVGNITVNGKTITNAVFVYHIALDSWTIYSLDKKPTIMANFSTAFPVSKVYFGSTDGRTYLLNSGTKDNTASIACEFISKEHLLVYPERTNVTWLDVFALKRVASTVYLDLDRLEMFESIGQLSTRTTNFRIPQRECNTVRVKIADNSNDTSVIEGYNIEHEPKAKRDEKQVKVRRQYP